MKKWTKKRWRTFIAATGLTVVGAGYWATHSPTTYSPAHATGCDDSLWEHVYNAKRFDLIDPCVRVNGTVTDVSRQADGDPHIRLHVDKGFEWMLTQRNIEAQHGDLVVEVVCAYPVTQANAVDACKGYQNAVLLPKVRQHVGVLGAFVTDKKHEGWNEIHPATKIVVL